MKFRTCSYEAEVSQALKDGHWPDGCTPELRTHVETCASCSDLVLVTQAFQGARKEAEAAPRVNSAGILWWRAQLRQRNMATRQISRPITIAQTFAFMVTVLVAGAFVGSQYNHGLRWGSWWSDLTLSRALHLLSMSSTKLDWTSVWLFSGLGALILLSGLVVLLVSEKS